MVNDKPLRRMTLRERLTHVEKRARDLIEQVQGDLLPRHDEFRDLSRPVRRRSHFPTFLAVQNALKKLEESAESTQSVADYLHENLADIREHAVQERANRR